MSFETTERTELSDTNVTNTPLEEDSVRELLVADERPVSEDPSDRIEDPAEVFDLTEDEAAETSQASDQGGGDNGGDKPELPVGDDDGEDDERGNENKEAEASAPQMSDYSILAVREIPSGLRDDGKGLRRKETLTETMYQLGERVIEESVVVGSNAIKEALGEDFRTPHDVDVAVSPDAFSYLRDQDGWAERRSENGGVLITNGEVEVGLGWNDDTQTYEKLRERSWVTESGILVAGLSDVFAYKTKRGTEKDEQDLAAMRERLQNPAASPLSERVTAREADVIYNCLPEHVRDHPDVRQGIREGAEGMLIVNTLYGDPEIGNVNQIVGDLEKPEYRVPATYHNGHDLPHDVRRLTQHMDDVNEADAAAGRPLTFSPGDYGDGVAAETLTDSVYGFGRRPKKQDPKNPVRYDEFRSAELARSRALQLGSSPERAERQFNLVHGTAFTEGTGEQLGKYSDDPLVQAICGVDLQSLSEKGLAFPLIVEDGFADRWSKARTAGKVADENNVTITTIDEGYQFYDTYADAKPSDAPGGPTVREYAVGRLRSNAGFAGWGYQYPPTWTRENKEQRLRNAARYYEAADAFENGIPLQAIARADQEYTAED